MRKIKAADWRRGVLVDTSFQRDLFGDRGVQRLVLRKHKDPVPLLTLLIDWKDGEPCLITIVRPEDEL
jgi:hypothetical protein